ncbi:MAG: hypothetical protein V3T88_06170, partial [Nitrosomonadaceae bacterium]
RVYHTTLRVLSLAADLYACSHWLPGMSKVTVVSSRVYRTTCSSGEDGVSAENEPLRRSVDFSHAIFSMLSAPCQNNKPFVTWSDGATHGSEETLDHQTINVFRS